MKRIVSLIVCSLCFLSGIAVNPTDTVYTRLVADSITTDSTSKFTLDAITSSRWYRATCVGVPLIVGGLIMKGEDDRFRSLRNDYMPKFEHHLDDYMQYAPAVAMLGMKAFGVKSRSSWGRMLTSDAFSAILMATAVNTLKHTTQVTRPDGSNNHSFPSGHTATAFMTATMLTKEYGHLSPWVGVGAYTIATATGLMRMANNKHWLSDVLTGAGIGILTTELGYYLADLIFKNKGIEKFEHTGNYDRFSKPSFLSLYMGINIPLGGYDIDEQLEFETSAGCTVGIEGAYFFNPYIGIGGRFAASNTSIIVNNETAEHETFDALSASAGAYFSYPLSRRWQAGTKLLAGYSHYPDLKLTERTVSKRDGICFGSGLSLTFKAQERCDLRFFLDYDLKPSHSTGSSEWMNALTCGISLAITF